MRKIILIILFIASLILLGFTYKLYRKNETKEKKLDLSREIREKINEINFKETDKESEVYDFELTFDDKIVLYNCLNKIESSVEYLNCSRKIDSILISKIGEETFIKAIANSYIYNGLYYLTQWTSRWDLDMSYSRYVEEKRKVFFLKKLCYSGYLTNIRSSDKLLKFYERYKPLMHKHITKELYTSRFMETVDGLLLAHDDLELLANKEDYIKSVYARADSTHLHPEPENWNITFWYRRELEKNDSVVYEILTDIKKHYEKDSSF